MDKGGREKIGTVLTAVAEDSTSFSSKFKFESGRSRGFDDMLPSGPSRRELVSLDRAPTTADAFWMNRAASNDSPAPTHSPSDCSRDTSPTRAHASSSTASAPLPFPSFSASTAATAAQQQQHPHSSSTTSLSKLVRPSNSVPLPPEPPTLGASVSAPNSFKGFMPSASKVVRQSGSLPTQLPSAVLSSQNSSSSMPSPSNLTLQHISEGSEVSSWRSPELASTKAPAPAPPNGPIGPGPGRAPPTAGGQRSNKIKHESKTAMGMSRRDVQFFDYAGDTAERRDYDPDPCDYHSRREESNKLLMVQEPVVLDLDSWEREMARFTRVSNGERHSSPGVMTDIPWQPSMASDLDALLAEVDEEHAAAAEAGRKVRAEQAKQQQQQQQRHSPAVAPKLLARVAAAAAHPPLGEPPSAAAPQRPKVQLAPLPAPASDFGGFPAHTAGALNRLSSNRHWVNAGRAKSDKQLLAKESAQFRQELATMRTRDSEPEGNDEDVPSGASAGSAVAAPPPPDGGSNPLRQWGNGNRAKSERTLLVANSKEHADVVSRGKSFPSVPTAPTAAAAAAAAHHVLSSGADIGEGGADWTPAQLRERLKAARLGPRLPHMTGPYAASEGHTPIRPVPHAGDTSTDSSAHGGYYGGPLQHGGGDGTPLQGQHHPQPPAAPAPTPTAAWRDSAFNSPTAQRDMDGRDAAATVQQGPTAHRNQHHPHQHQQSQSRHPSMDGHSTSPTHAHAQQLQQQQLGGGGGPMSMVRQYHSHGGYNPLGRAQKSDNGCAGGGGGNALPESIKEEHELRSDASVTLLDAAASRSEDSSPLRLKDSAHAAAMLAALRRRRQPRLSLGADEADVQRVQQQAQAQAQARTSPTAAAAAVTMGAGLSEAAAATPTPPRTALEQYIGTSSHRLADASSVRALLLDPSHHPKAPYGHSHSTDSTPLKLKLPSLVGSQHFEGRREALPPPTHRTSPIVDAGF